MPIDKKQAKQVLDFMIEKAKGEADGCWCKHYNKSWLCVDTRKGAIKYTWGVNEVCSATALNVIMTFEGK